MSHEANFAQQEKWFGHLDAINLAIKALRDCRESIRCSDRLERSPVTFRLITDLTRYAEQRLRDECGGTYVNGLQWHRDHGGDDAGD